MPFPNDVRVTVMDRVIEYSLRERGGTCNIQEVKNNIVFKVHSSYPKRHLTYADYISAEQKAKGIDSLRARSGAGSYKYYTLEEDGDQIKASWGDIQGIRSQRSCNYPVSMFWIKYYEKIAKGYIDNSEAYLNEDVPAVDIKVSDKKKAEIKEEPKKEEKKIPENKLSQKLFSLLSGFAKKVIDMTFGCTVNSKSQDNKNQYNNGDRISGAFKVTQGMVNKSKEYLKLLYETTSLDEFNRILLQLCMVCPRKVWDMKSLMAQTKDDIPNVLQREEDLVDAMEGLLLGKEQKISEKTDNRPKENPDPFADLGITISDVSKVEEDKVLKMLTPELKNKVAGIYKVTNKVHEDRFKKYLKAKGITKTMFLWHGSRNENWLSIMNKGLLLKPNAVITGKMFGNGIYFAPKASKSWGYTSYSGSYWARGGANIAFMGVYETAYGNPHHPTRNETWNYTEDRLKKLSKDCVHARGGECGLRNDEIIFYNEAAMCLRYIVEFQ